MCLSVDKLKPINKKMTNQLCQELMDSTGIDRCPISGTPGEFYQDNRKEDALSLIKEILDERNKTS